MVDKVLHEYLTTCFRADVAKLEAELERNKVTLKALENGTASVGVVEDGRDTHITVVSGCAPDGYVTMIDLNPNHYATLVVLNKP